MGIGAKLLWPIVLAFTLLMGVIHFYFVPRLLDSERESVLRHEHEVLNALETGLVQDLLLGDLAAIYATLDSQIENRGGVWAWLELRNANGKRLYPLGERPRPDGEYLVALDHIMELDGARVAHISLVADLEAEYLAGLVQMRDIEQLLLLVLFVLLAVGLWLQQRWVRQPLARLELAATQISRGEFDIALPAVSDDEIGRLTRAFEDMRTNLQSAQQVLIDARLEAEKASQAKSAFLSRMSHELRTPMNAILGFAQLLELEARDPNGREFIAEILKAGDHLLKLIDEVLDLARVESGKVELVLEDVDAQSLCDESIALVRSLARESGVGLSVQTGGIAGARIHVDGTRLKQVLVNLLSNAIKYNHLGGRVTLSGERRPAGRFRFSVSDTGKGLDKAQQQRLFNPFDRLGAEKDGVHGTGIGLVISKRLVEEMGGELGYHSRVGQGSTFWIEVDAAEQGRNKDAEAVAEGASALVEAASHGRRATVLYIEDNRANRYLVRRIIEQHTSYLLLSAPDAVSGIALAHERLPDLILMDINLPDMDGFSALSRLRSQGRTKSIPVIAVSANAMTRQVERGRAGGFVAYLTKPIAVKSLLEAISSALGAAAAGGEGARFGHAEENRELEERDK